MAEDQSVPGTRRDRKERMEIQTALKVEPTERDMRREDLETSGEEDRRCSKESVALK